MSADNPEDDVGESCDIYIRRNADGIEHVYKWADHGIGFFDYNWREGNWGCDCNRYLFFCRAIGEEEEDDHPCGDHRYAAKVVSLTGEILFSDYERRQ